MSVKPTNPQINRSHPLARGLVGAWAFQDGGGGDDAREIGKGNLTATKYYSGALSWERCELGSAVALGGAGYVIDGFPFLQQFTLSAWLRVSSWTAGHSSSDTPIFCQYLTTGNKRMWLLIRDSDTNKFYMRVSDNGAFAGHYTDVFFGGAIESAPWAKFRHVVLTANNATRKWDLYIDRPWETASSQIKHWSLTQSRSYVDRGTSLYVAAYGPMTGATSFSIADLKAFNRVLSPSEIADLYARPFDLYEPAVGIQERYYRANAPIGAIGTGLHAIEAGGVYGAPGINSGLHAIDTGVVTA